MGVHSTSSMPQVQDCTFLALAQAMGEGKGWEGGGNRAWPLGDPASIRETAPGNHCSQLSSRTDRVKALTLAASSFHHQSLGLCASLPPAHSLSSRT